MLAPRTHRTPTPVRTRWSAPLGALLAVTALLAGLVLALAPAQPARAAATLLSQGRPVTASSTENAGTPASAAVDGDNGTRWSSAAADPQWIQVDLGSAQALSQVVLRWETAYAKAYQVQVSADGANWTSVYSTTTGTGGTETLNVTGTGRYVRVYGTQRATAYGYSLWEFQVYGAATAPSSCGASNAAQGRPATASSAENAGTPASAAVDGNAGTRWSSAFGDPQWIQVDLGSVQSLCRVQLQWETAAAKAYQLQTSADGANWTSVYSTTTGTGGTETLNVTGTGRYVRVYGTARTTAYGYSLWEFQVFTTGGGSNSPSPSPSPSTSQPADPFWGDTGSIPAAQNVLTVKVLNRTNGAYPDSQVYWSFNGQVHSIAEQPYLDMPANSSGRMYFYLGSPTSRYADFIEFTVGPDVFNGNTTRVDAWALPLAMRLHAADGYDVQVGDAQSVFNESRTQLFQDFANAVPQEFKVLAQTEAPYRIIAPGSDPSFRTGGVNANYFTAYASSVGVNESTSNIFGCAGSMAADPGMCSALNRHVATLPQSQWSDPSKYYAAGPANYYAKFWHDRAIDGLAYGFPYDDYASQSSYVSHADPQWLEVAVGF
ncbi:discoidin domain-containing protein [Kitasatospora phosalacinea]|uniref:discoidin domain-containing protein n=1 Tax=Kitasatospora phosalacinea TaxID=2065 RepID=UPI00364C95C4